MKTIIQRLQPHTVSIYHLTDDVVEEQVVDARSLLNPLVLIYSRSYIISGIERKIRQKPKEFIKSILEHLIRI
jgi:hypothetical protein